MSIGHALFATYANPLRIVDGADFDGVDDRLSRGAGLSGLADGKSGSLSAWVRLDADPSPSGAVFNLMIGSGSRLTVDYNPGIDSLRVIGANAAGTTILSIRSTTALTPGASWIHLLASWDLANAGSARIYVNDVSDLTQTTYTNDTLDYTGDGFFVGNHPVGGTNWNGCMAELWFAPNVYLDFDLVYWRRQFRSASGKPLHLGADGSLATGVAPPLYLHLDDGEAVGNFATNRGTGGNLSVLGGGLASASSSPSD